MPDTSSRPSFGFRPLSATDEQAVASSTTECAAAQGTPRPRVSHRYLGLVVVWSINMRPQRRCHDGIRDCDERGKVGAQLPSHGVHRREVLTDMDCVCDLPADSASVCCCVCARAPEERRGPPGDECSDGLQALLDGTTRAQQLAEVNAEATARVRVPQCYFRCT